MWGVKKESEGIIKISKGNRIWGLIYIIVYHGRGRRSREAEFETVVECILWRKV